MIETPYQQDLTKHAIDDMKGSEQRSHELWTVLFDGQELPIAPTHSERGAHARAKSQMFYWRYRSNLGGAYGTTLLQADRDKEFLAGYKDHCKAHRLL